MKVVFGLDVKLEIGIILEDIAKKKRKGKSNSYPLLDTPFGYVSM